MRIFNLVQSTEIGADWNNYSDTDEIIKNIIHYIIGFNLISHFYYFYFCNIVIFRNTHFQICGTASNNMMV